MTCGAVPQPREAKRREYRVLPARTGASEQTWSNICAGRSRPMFRTMPVKVQLPVTWYTIAASGVR
jgi:hypothetical protein